MSIYKNIFHYYRGPSIKGAEETKHLQIENNTTKAFVNILQNSSPTLTMKLTKWLGLNGNENDTFEYMYQVSNELHRKTPQAVVIGIAETKNMINNLQMKKYYTPDGAILSDNVSILIETKIGLNSYLEINQLEGHKKRFAINQKVEKNIILTWSDIRNFLQEQYQFFKKSNDVLTCFLLEQFEEFCVINCIGGTKTNEYFFLQFEKVKAQKLARKIHDYIWNESGYPDIQDAGTKDGIGYKRVSKPKFATLSIQRQRHFILHFGKKEERLGLSIQEEIDKMLSRNFHRPDYEIEKYPHEAYIRLEWVDNFDQIKPYIDLAYNLRS
ncbi:hypothetical protein [Peribacillus frigoritolerans]|uniref:hypothetical protein n=1 Tax=Peribacillus frigoritolerans TaxID=450367 RepID=UPI000A0592CC|nr:hypothetical protein [Peribacillus frigoritolerans]